LRVEPRRVDIDGVRREVVRKVRARRPKPFGEAEAERELFVVTRCPHRHCDGAAADPDLERLLDGDVVALGPPVGQPHDVHGGGRADELRHRGVTVFGPGAGAARIEGSKAFSKEVMDAAGVPTARTLAVAQPPCVVKADGLAAGKGVWVCRTQQELDAGLRAAEALGQPFHVEEFLEGEEVSIFALCDGVTALPLPAAQDYKRIDDNDEGANTGGMGSYSPVQRLSDNDVSELVDLACTPILRELAQRRMSFIGALFAGVMLTD